MAPLPPLYGCDVFAGGVRMKKVYPDARSALDGVLFDGMLIASGGFGLCGIPELLIAAIRDAGT
jgi:3-oxoacid CoA-transferase subunit A